MCSVSPRNDPPLRRDRVDRQRNRENIVASARKLFAEADKASSSVSLYAIAREAGVGIATLYRHFPTRETLAEAVYIDKVDELTLAAASDSANCDAAVALRTWLNRYAAFMLSSRGMMDTLVAGWASGTVASSGATERICEIIAEFLDRGAADGTIRPDAGADDVTVALLGLLTAAASDHSGEQAARLFDVFLAGLSPPS